MGRRLGDRLLGPAVAGTGSLRLPVLEPPDARWHDDEALEDRGDASERPAAVYYAPAGECEYCDRRRGAARRGMRARRERGEG